MRQDYQTVNTITLTQKKGYLLKICQDINIENQIVDCMNIKQMNRVFHTFQQQLYIYAYNALYQSQSYDELEYHLMMMNHFFHNKSYCRIKKELFQKLSQRTITIDEYCIIRHLIDFQKQPFSQFIDILQKSYHVHYEECAKICLLEDQPKLAYQYLKQLDQCENEALLDLLCSYSVYDYVSLMKNYKKKARNLQFVPSP